MFTNIAMDGWLDNSRLPDSDRGPALDAGQLLTWDFISTIVPGVPGLQIGIFSQNGCVRAEFTRTSAFRRDLLFSPV